MGGQAAELAAIRAKAPGSLTPQDKARALEISAALSQKITQMKGMGGATALNVEALSEGLKLDQQFGPESPFNTTLAQATAPLKTDMHTASEKLTYIATIAEKWIGGLFNNPLLMGIGSAFVVANGFLGIIARNTGSLTGGLFDKFMGKKGGGGGAAKGAAKGAEKVIEKEVAEGVAKTASKSIGKSILKKIPGIGIIAGLAFAGEQAMAGNWKGAGLEAASGVVGGTDFLSGPAGIAGSAALDVAAAAQEANFTPSEDSQKDIADTSNGITEQLKKMDATNDFLKTISDNSITSAEYMEKLLYVAMMSDKDKQAAATRLQLMKDNRFGSQYGYTM
jgi:hypothetical protein